MLLLLVVRWLSVVATITIATITVSATTGNDLGTEDHEEAIASDATDLPMLLDLGLIPRPNQSENSLDIANLAGPEIDSGPVNNVPYLPNDASRKTISSLLTPIIGGAMKMTSDPEVTVRQVRQEASRKHRTKSTSGYCQRHNLYVNFTTLGWNKKIVAPDGYNAYYCQGDCNFPLSDNGTPTSTHAWVQSLVHTMNSSTAPNPCCAPTVLGGMSIIFLDGNNQPKYKKYKDMVVLECGCR